MSLVAIHYVRETLGKDLAEFHAANRSHIKNGSSYSMYVLSHSFSTISSSMDPDNHHQQHGVTETTSFLRPENGAESTGKKQESWSDLKPFIRPLVAINFLSIVCGLNDGSIVGWTINLIKYVNINSICLIGCYYSTFEGLL